jgi:AraC-like DNA-binding protein
MKPKFTLRARVSANFVAVEIKNGSPVAPIGATSYYARFTDETGQRRTKPLGKDLPAAFAEFQKMEIDREEKIRNSLHLAQVASDIDDLSLGRVQRRLARIAIELRTVTEILSKHEIMLGTLRGEVASLSVLANGLLDPKRRNNNFQTHLSLNAAAKQAGVGRKALKTWLARDLGICFPRVPHGSKILVRQRDVEYVLARRRDARNVDIGLRGGRRS